MHDMLMHSPQGEKAMRHIELTRDLLRRTPLSECYAQLSRFQQHMAGDLLSRMYALKQVADPEPPQLADLPASLVDRFVGQHGRHLLKIYGRGNIWDTKALERFVKDVRTVDTQVTGNPLQAYEASLEMKKSYLEAAFYALLVTIVVLLFDFRDWRYALIASLPLAIGLLQTYGLLGLLDIPLNPANLIALPMILGFGEDYGVHIVHEFRDSRGPYRMTSATAIAVLIDGLTTMVGFGAMIIASHQGLQSLGRVLTIAVTCCMFTSMVMLPAVLAWFTRNRKEVDDDETAEPSAEMQSALVEPVRRAA
jgi:predicted RND superfamily exporter protein